MTDRPTIAAIVLAAGCSTRMGDTNKLLADFHGLPMIAQTLAQVKAAGIEPVYVVTGHEAEKVKAALSNHHLRFVDNAQFYNGLATSLVAGIKALSDDIDGALIILGDMPLVRAENIAALVGAFKQHLDICVPFFQGRRGNPVVWGRGYFSQLKKLEGDQGARKLLSLHGQAVIEVEMVGDGILRDFDTASELAKV